MSTLGKFTRQYSLSKTLRFELKPIGRTKELMSRLLEEDIQRASDFLEVKKIIDRYHKHIIEDVLAECELCKNEEGESTDLLKEYYNAYKESLYDLNNFYYCR